MKNKKSTINEEYVLLAVWKDAMAYKNSIEQEICKSFELSYAIEINWSIENFALNALRLYETHWFIDLEDLPSNFGHIEKIGSTNFMLYVLKDCNPKYRYNPSVSGSIELCNINIMNLKEKIRGYIFKKTNKKFSVHSTNNFNEFRFQSTLLLGINKTECLLKGQPLNYDGSHSEDLIGSKGWKNWNEVFRALNLSCNYVVLRGFEELPYNNPEKDLDLLTDDFQRLASLLGVFQFSSQPYKGTMLVAGEHVSVDIRYIGDHYFDTRFQINVLGNRLLKNGIYVPRDDDYFFSLLYHCKVHKDSVKPKYFEILRNLAIKLELNWFENSMLNDDTKVKNILAGYYRAHRYVYISPVDEGVYANKVIVDALPTNKPRFNILGIIKAKIRLITPNLLLYLRRKFLNFIYK